MNSPRIEKALPFVKWAGGKRAVLPQILPRMPKTYGDFWEPFVGGGAVFFALRAKGFEGKAHISDMNGELIATYHEIQEEPAALIERLKLHAEEHKLSSPWKEIIKEDGTTKKIKREEGYYYHVRSEVPNERIERAARMLYLNRTCFNGLYRVNSKGGFNVPAGSYKDPDVVQEERLKSCHLALQNTNISLHGYENIQPQPNDFVYLDPPYDIWNATSFTKYASGDFNWDDQIKLADFAVNLREQGVNVMLSNHATKRIIELYIEKGFHIHTFPVGRPVASKAENRVAVYEVLMTSYSSNTYNEIVTNEIIWPTIAD